MNIQIARLPHAAGLPLPAYETAGAAGMDLRAAVAEDAPLTLKPRDRAMVPTGWPSPCRPAIEAQVRPRSGLAAKAGITCLNTPGTIDSDYRGEVKVILINLGAEDFIIRRGDRIAQMVIAPWSRPPGARRTASTRPRAGPAASAPRGASCAVANAALANLRQTLEGPREKTPLHGRIRSLNAPVPADPTVHKPTLTPA